ncbi:MAG: hypothetical protein HKM04_07865 [Legionellales bacterium]|nr:hypothetical protein [Legionellales bacterium]
MFKKITLIIPFFFCALPELVFAAEPGDLVAQPTGLVLMAPETAGEWAIGLEAQMMMPIDKFQFVQGALIQPDGSTIYHNESVDNEHDWGWEADVAYQFADTGRDVRFSYTDLNMSDTEQYQVSPDTILYGINGRNNPLTITDGGSAYGTATYHYRAADLIVGQLLTVGERLTLHPFAGLRYGKIDIVGVAKYIQDDGQENKFTSDSTFNGIGPRAGIDANIRLWYGFSLVGSFGTSLLLGNLNENYQIGTNVQQGGSSTYINNKNAEIFSVIPELDGSYGINYHANLNTKTGLDLQFGEQVVNYFNADEHDYFDTVYVNSTVKNASFGYHGIYIRSQLSFI